MCEGERGRSGKGRFGGIEQSGRVDWEIQTAPLLLRSIGWLAAIATYNYASISNQTIAVKAS